ncbi:MAG: UbiH/UbiF/VisC/COQ6 family ubiquinone biosynthesis hydroxylase [Gammaproteobacteria bacterium]|nr:UbiH/UbiF/VisC/COQ6 family ubiquinone biosynthesis hydroxylase [Gammaproteobacteria bacterium]
MNQFDIIIIGGGIVGATAARALGKAGLRVAVVEARQPLPVEQQQPDPRVFAITRASERIFRSLGVWESIVAQGAFAFSDMEVWDACGEGVTHFDCAELGEPYLGHIIEPRLIETGLSGQLASDNNISLFCPARFRAVESQNENVTVTLEDGQCLTASLLVAADGVRSPVREALGIRTRSHDYRQSSVVARVKTSEPHRDTAWQRFLPGGPLAFLPMQEGWSSIVWTLSTAEAERVMSLDQPAFHAELAEAFAYRLGSIVASGERESWPLQRMHAEHYVIARTALIGDAAHAIHPLAGQGVNLGLLDAATLTEVIVAAVQGGRDPGALRVLRRYERWRRGDNLLMMSAMDALNRTFSNAQSPLSQVRNLGLSLVNNSAGLRQLFMRHAMGLEGDLPALAAASEKVPSSG